MECKLADPIHRLRYFKANSCLIPKLFPDTMADRESIQQRLTK